jgi:hypothetical protein
MVALLTLVILTFFAPAFFVCRVCLNCSFDRDSLVMPTKRRFEILKLGEIDHESDVLLKQLNPREVDHSNLKQRGMSLEE